MSLVSTLNRYLEAVSRRTVPRTGGGGGGTAHEAQASGCHTRHGSGGGLRRSTQRWRERASGGGPGGFGAGVHRQGGVGLSDNAGVAGPDRLRPCTAAAVRVVEGGGDTERSDVFPRLRGVLTEPAAGADARGVGEDGVRGHDCRSRLARFDRHRGSREARTEGGDGETRAGTPSARARRGRDSRAG